MLFYRSTEGEDISKEISYYKKAKERFVNKYNDIPIRVREWKLLVAKATRKKYLQLKKIGQTLLILLL